MASESEDQLSVAYKTGYAYALKALDQLESAYQAGYARALEVMNGMYEAKYKEWSECPQSQTLVDDLIRLNYAIQILAAHRPR